MIMNWMHLTWSAVQLSWVHEISQSALALAVALLGVVILLELASIARLRRTTNQQLQRVLEQLALLRGEKSAVPPGAGPSAAAPSIAAPAAAGSVPAYAAPPLGAGEARLLAALASARARLDRSESSAGASA